MAIIGGNVTKIRTYLWLSAAAISLPLASTAYAQPVETRQIDVPPQPLGAALNQIGRQTKTEVIFTSVDVQGKRTPAVHGTYTAPEALQIALQGTSLSVRKTPQGAYLVEQAPGSGEAGAGSAVATDESADIVVTAQRREQRLQDIPISVSVMRGASLQEGNLRNLEDIANRLPNVKIAASPASDQVHVRGVGSSLNSGFEQSVGTFVDGIYRGRSRSTRAALFDIERIEVLKGPQTTFFGNNTIAGALNITTKRPGHDLAVNALTFFAPEANEYAIEAGVDIPITGTLKARIAGRMSGMDGYIRNENLHRSGPHLNDKMGRVSLVWQPNDRIETHTRLDVGRMRGNDTFNAELLGCPPDPIFGAPRGVCLSYLNGSGGDVDDELNGVSVANSSFSHYDFLELSNSIAIDFGNVDLILTTGYFDHSFKSLTDGIPIPGRFSSAVGTDHAAPVSYFEDFHQFSQEVRLQSKSGQTFEYMVGAYYSRSKLNLDTYAGLYFNPIGASAPDIFTATTPVAIRVPNKETSETLSAFASGTIHVTDKARLNLGVRYSQTTKKVNRIPQIGVGGNIPGPGSFSPSAEALAILSPFTGLDLGNFANPRRKDDKIMPTASVQYDISDRIMGYVSYAKGFKAGGYSAFVTSATFDPETVDAYETGLKASFGRVATASLALFYSKYKNLQETTTIITPSGAGKQIVDNVAASTSKGIEFSGTLRVFDDLILSADVAYLDAKYSRYPSAPCTVLQGLEQSSCSQDLSGKRRAFAPEFSGNIGLSYTLELSGDLEARFNGNAHFSSDYFQQPLADPTLEQNGFMKIDARIGIGPADRSWELAVIGKNLTNRRTASFRQFVATSPGATLAVPDPSRSIGGQLSVRF